MPILTTLMLGGVGGLLLERVAAKRAKKKAGKLLPTPESTDEELPENTDKVMSAAETTAAHHQKVSLGAMGLIALSAVTTPALSLMALPLLGYSYIHQLRRMLEAYQRKISLFVVIFDVVSLSAMLLLGYFFTTSLVFFALFTVSRLIARTERAAQTDFSRIFGELSDTVWLVKEGTEIESPIDSLKVNDVVAVHVGEMVPVDGYIVAGEGLIDQHLLTGEAQPVEKKVGDAVMTSTLLVSGYLQVVVEKQGVETITGQIAETLEHAAKFKSRVQSRGDRIVEKGAARTLLASGAAIPFIGLSHAVALTYSGFGYQMRMAAPLMVLNYLRIASRRGILVKDGRALDTLVKVDAIVFDKTGTLTETVPQVGYVFASPGISEQQVLQYAASAEQQQDHPIAQAICQHAESRGITPLQIMDTDYLIGHGLQVTLKTTQQKACRVMIGSERFVRSQGITLPESLEHKQSEAGDKGYSMVYLASGDGQLLGAIELRPGIRPEAKQTITALQQAGVKCYIISGDQEKPTRHLADILGIDHYFAETLPADKAAHVKALQNQGHTVCFIGDGINDSVALQAADVSVSLHGAATIAKDTAEIVLLNPDLLHLPYLIKMAGKLEQRMRTSEIMNNASGIACVSGILFLGMGIGGAITLFTGGLLVNTSGAMLPLLESKKDFTKDAKKTEPF